MKSQKNQKSDVKTLKKEMEERKQTKKDLTQYTERLKILHDIDRAILEAQSPKEIAQATLSHLRKLVSCVRTSVVSFILEYDEARVLVTDVDGEPQLGPGDLIPLELFGDIEKISQGQVNIFKDLTKISNPSKAVRALIDEGVRSYINIPLISRGELIGLLNLGSKTPGGISEKFIRISQEVADSLASAMEDARLLDKVRKYQNELKRFSSKIIEAQEMERKRISMELHDEMGQALTAIRINLAAIEKELPQKMVSRIKEKFTDTYTIIDQSMEKIRELVVSLRPSMLDDLGLIPTLRWLFNKYKQRTSLHIDFKALSFQKKLSVEVETILYRIVQEALNNVVKHAQASNVIIRLECDEESIQGFVRDDGKGFDVNTVLSSETKERGIGLIGMRERITFLGGHFDIKSTPGKGTQLHFGIPFNPSKKS